MATDRDEEQPEQQRQQELEEIRRSFAEMGTRMGTWFEPAELGQPQQQPGLPVRPPAASISAPAPAARVRSRWWAGAVVLVFLAGVTLGWILPRGEDGAASPPPTQPTAVTPVRASSPPASVIRTPTSVPRVCVDTAKLADEVISRLDRNQHGHRLTLALRDYTRASQACRRKASP